MLAIVRLACVAPVVAVGHFILTGTATASAASLISNGSFESPRAPAMGSKNTKSISGWSVFGPSELTLWNGVLKYDIYLFYPESGNQWLNLNHAHNGISQAVATQRNKSYKLYFWLSGVPLSFDSVVGVSINSKLVLKVPVSALGSSMAWSLSTVTFKATGASTTIEFKNMDDAQVGIDHVSVKEIINSSTKEIVLPAVGSPRKIDLDKASLAPK